MTPTATYTTSSNGASNCSCASHTGFAERPRFFPRQMVTPDDLTLGVDYVRNKLRRHNRYLHGWGTVCGTRVVKPSTNQPWKVIVQKGYLLGPYGDEILIDHDVCFDLRKKCMSGTTGDPCADAASQVQDPLCSDPAATPPPAGPVYVAVRYQETMAQPVRVQPVGCGCDDTQCEYSRWQDGYEICVLDSCPASHSNPPDLNNITQPAGIPDCPACPTDPWLVLASVTLDATGAVQTIDNCSCRRMVISLWPYWTRCNESAVTTGPPKNTPGPPANNP